MTSPFVRRRRLAAEIRTLREQQGMTADDLSRRIFRSRMTISKLENARCRPDLADIMKILDALDVTGDRWHEILNIAACWRPESNDRRPHSGRMVQGTNSCWTSSSYVGSPCPPTS